MFISKGCYGHFYLKFNVQQGLLDPGGLHIPVDLLWRQSVHMKLLKLPAAVRLVDVNFFVVSSQLREGGLQQFQEVSLL